MNSDIRVIESMEQDTVAAASREGRPHPFRDGDPSTVTDAEVRRAVDLFKVLAHPDRLRLACALGDGRVTTQKALMEEFGWPQSTTARHLALLRNAGLIAAERDGAEVRLRLGDPVVLDLMDTICSWVHGPGSGLDAAPRSTSAPILAVTPPFSGTDAHEEGSSNSSP